MKFFTDKVTREAYTWIGLGMFCLALLFLPSLVNGGPVTNPPAAFTNPLGNILDIKDLIQNLIKYIVGLSGVLALLAMVVGGVYIAVGGFDNEQNVAKGKKILFWGIAGMLVVGLATLFLTFAKAVLGF